MILSFGALSDDQLIAQVQRCAAREREATSTLIAALAELDARRLHLAAGCSSLFTYCTQVLHFSEYAAYARIEAARVARRLPLVLDLLTEGAITLTTVGLLAPHLTPENHRDVLAASRYKSKREMEQLVAALRPKPEVASIVRKLPVKPMDQVAAMLNTPFMPPPVPSAACARSDPRATVAPVAPERFKIQVTVSREAHDNLRRAQDLLRHSIPNGDPAVIVERALALLVSELERKKMAMAARPRSRTAPALHSRHVPAGVKREVWKRDGGQCAFAGTEGRCRERGFLEYHHVVPYADGGTTTADNLQLRCRAHNVYEMERDFRPLCVREAGSEYVASAGSGPS